MRAILYDHPGEADVLYRGTVPTPVPTEQQVLVRVAATSLNRADILQRRGLYPPPPGASSILGLEVSGTIVSVGSAVTRWKTGDRVMGLVPGGGYAEYATLHEDLAMPVEDNDLVRAAAVPEVFLTAWQALFFLGKLRKGQTVLLHAGASGGGTAAIQLATRIARAHVYVTASAGKHALCLKLGARAAIDYKKENFTDRILTLTGDKGVDLIVDCIGAPYVKPNLRALAMDGTIVMLSMLGGSRVSDLYLGSLFRKRATMIATTLRNRSLNYKIRLTNQFFWNNKEQITPGGIYPVIDSVFDWTEVQMAHRHMETNKNMGKIVLRIGGNNAPDQE